LPAHQGSQWVVFRLEEGRYALPLHAVERIVRAAQITPVPLAPAIVLGAIDVQGRILPVFDLRRRFGLPARALAPSDHFLIANTERRTVVLLIDAAHGVIGAPATVVESEQLAPDLAHIRGVFSLPDGLVLIQDLEQFLSPDESAALDLALTHAEETRHAS
jgi:purine-binding chemotaxis protein CheW